MPTLLVIAVSILLVLAELLLVAIIVAPKATACALRALLAASARALRRGIGALARVGREITAGRRVLARELIEPVSSAEREEQRWRRDQSR